MCKAIILACHLLMLGRDYEQLFHALPTKNNCKFCWKGYVPANTLSGRYALKRQLDCQICFVGTNAICMSWILWALNFTLLFTLPPKEDMKMVFLEFFSTLVCSWTLRALSGTTESRQTPFGEQDFCSFSCCWNGAPFQTGVSQRVWLLMNMT